MEQIMYNAIATCDSCHKELIDDFTRKEPLISVKMNLSRRNDCSCGSIRSIKTNFGFCCFQCLWDYLNDGNLESNWYKRCGDK